MDCDRVSIIIKDDEISEQRSARLKELNLVEPHRQGEFNCQGYLQLRRSMREGKVDKFIEDLEKYSADITNTQGPSGNSLLHIAAGIQNADFLRALLEVFHGKGLVAKANRRGDTALHIAARAGRIDLAEDLLRCGSIVDMVNDAGNTALHEAVKNGHQKFTDLLLDRGSRTACLENKERKCPLYLAVETGNSEILKRLMEAMDKNEVPWSRIQGMSPVLGAVIHRKKGMLEEMSKWKKELFGLRDARGGTPLHVAAYVNYVRGVKFLLENFASSAFEGDEDGYLPIHVACKMGHLTIMKMLLSDTPDPEELLSLEEGQNILHVAAKYGRTSVVNYILGDHSLEKLINAKDKEGNTPLHVATFEWQPRVLLSLTRDSRVDLKLVNNNNSTALDIVDEQLKQIDAPLHKRLARTILTSARAPSSKEKAICLPKGIGPGRDVEPPDLNRMKDEANTRMVVATLIATMTFAAGFSVPGGNNDSEPNAGIATLLNKPMYDVFVICNTVAMYSSIIAVVNLLWIQIPDPWAMLLALRNARLPLLIALATMSGAFVAGVFVTISKRTWIAVVVLIIGVAALFVVLSLYIVLFLPLRYNCRLAQMFADYIIAGILILTSVTEERARQPARQGKSKSEDGSPSETASAPEMADEAIEDGDTMETPYSRFGDGVLLMSAEPETDSMFEDEVLVMSAQRETALAPVVSLETHLAQSKNGGNDPENLYEVTGAPLNMGDETEDTLEIRRAEKSIGKVTT